MSEPQSTPEPSLLRGKTAVAAARAGARIPPARVLLGLAALVALAILGRFVGSGVPQFASWVEGLGIWGPLVFGVGYVVATVAFVPGSLLTLAAGAIFGVPLGTLLVFCAATLGAGVAFLVSRHVARNAIEQRLAGNARFAAIDRAVAEEGRRMVLLLRLSPIFPFNLLNYALGLTKVRFADYMLASIGMLPGTLLYVYYGALAGEVAALAGGVAVRGAGYYGMLAVGLIATIAVTGFVTRTARRALREVTEG